MKFVAESRESEVTMSRRMNVGKRRQNDHESWRKHVIRLNRNSPEWPMSSSIVCSNLELLYCMWDNWNERRRDIFGNDIPSQTQPHCRKVTAGLRKPLRLSVFNRVPR